MSEEKEDAMSSEDYWSGYDPVSRRVFLGRGARAAGVVVGGASLASLIGASAASAASSSEGTNDGSIPAPSAAEIAKASGTLNVLGATSYESHQNDPKGLTVKWAYNTTNEQIITKTTQPGTFDIVIIYQGEIDQSQAGPDRSDRPDEIPTSRSSARSSGTRP